ncbi:tyrosine-protein phosphatase [Streptomyces noboritoensis]|uniref:Tyrosine-protein phosphatase n=1 Tax=Streptomyces noboritoensis TaxID=67337 RepID=A0ABV6TSA8_9ACTN
MTAIPAHSVANLRDLGGTPLAGGRTVRPGLVFRAGALDRFDPDRDPAVAALGIRTVVDLRTAAERAERPDRLPSGARLVVADVLADAVSESGPPAAARLRHVLADPVAAEQHLGGGRARAVFEDLYRDLVSSPSARAAYRTLLLELADPEAGGPVLFHCTAGKDRTGWGATVLLSLLGASAEVVMREYLAVNGAVREAFAPLIEGFTAQGGDPEVALAVVGVVREYLAAGLGEVSSRYGSMGAYVREGLGVGEESLGRLRTRLVDSPTPPLL